MESFVLSKAVLELGKRLVEQLQLDDDLLAQWMAHDISVRMNAVEDASSPEEARLAQDRCAKSILGLWEHRNELPSHLRPFRELEPLVRTLISLDTDSGDDHRYFRPILRDAALDQVEDPAAKEWLELAFGLDYSARLLIQYALRNAGAAAASNAASWVTAAMEAGADPVLERRVVAFLSSDQPSDGDAQAANQSLLRQKVGKLEAFASLAADVAAQMRKQLEPKETKPEGASASDHRSGKRNRRRGATK